MSIYGCWQQLWWQLATRPQDYVIITLKAHSVSPIVDKILPLLGPDTSVVTAQNGIAPVEGSRMLRNDTPWHAGTDVYQMVDVTAFATDIDAGTVTLDLEGHFNGSAGVLTSVSLHWFAS